MDYLPLLYPLRVGVIETLAHATCPSTRSIVRRWQGLGVRVRSYFVHNARDCGHNRESENYQNAVGQSFILFMTLPPAG